MVTSPWTRIIWNWGSIESLIAWLSEETLMTSLGEEGLLASVGCMRLSYNRGRKKKTLSTGVSKGFKLETFSGFFNLLFISFFAHFLSSISPNQWICLQFPERNCPKKPKSPSNLKIQRTSLRFKPSFTWLKPQLLV